MAETLQDVLDGVAPFPEPGTRVMDVEWCPESEFGSVVTSAYPYFTVQWDDETVSSERVRY